MKVYNKEGGILYASSLIWPILALQMHFSNKTRKKKVVRAFFMKIFNKLFSDWQSSKGKFSLSWITMKMLR
jgi:hypothetical protein